MHPDEDPSLALSKVTGAASRTTVLNDHGKHNPIAEIADFLKPELQLLVRAKPILKEAANGRPALEDVPERPPLKDSIRSEAAGRRVEITTIRSLKRPAQKLNRIGVLDSSDIRQRSIQDRRLRGWSERPRCSRADAPFGRCDCLLEGSRC